MARFYSLVTMVTIANGRCLTSCHVLLQASDIIKINIKVMHYDPSVPRHTRTISATT